MKATIAVLILLCMLWLSSDCWAQEPEDFGLTAKQGALYSWKSKEFDNLTTFELAKTKPVEGWGMWNILWDGWSLDGGFGYDMQAIDKGALVLGREFGTLAKYLSIDFPLKDKLTITLYPIGIQAQGEEGNIFKKPKFSACSGGAIVKVTIKL